MKKISIILFTCLFICNNSYADHKGWPHGKKWAYNCVKTTDCNIVIENILEQPKLFIGKSVINGGNKVKVSMRFRGREMEHQNLGFDLLKKLTQEVSHIAKVEVPPKGEGKQIMMVLVPQAEK